jgi:hypothetical protein
MSLNGYENSLVSVQKTLLFFNLTGFGWGGEIPIDAFGTCDTLRESPESMKQETAMFPVKEIMSDFARLTGLRPAGSVPRRYLWTDAFAVCNFLCLHEQSGDAEFKNLALELVDQVHEVLGRHRSDDERTGRLSGLDEEEGRHHPTVGGLRIGKQLQERRQDEPLDEQLEWERDGQYYHYLTKWMHALNRVTTVTGDFTFNRWATELAKTVHSRFVCALPSGKRKRMYWKVSIDLAYPLVESMGLHDPLDGLITYNELQTTAARYPGKPAADLNTEIAEMADMCRGKSWVTDDPLGIGGLLSDTFRVAQLMLKGRFKGTGLLGSLLETSQKGLEYFARDNFLRLSADYRLAFRELGLSIGLGALEKLSALVERKEGAFSGEQGLGTRMKTLMQYGPLKEVIDTFWLQPQSRESNSWKAHRDINMVMLATSLSPDGFLII